MTIKKLIPFVLALAGAFCSSANALAETTAPDALAKACASLEAKSYESAADNPAVIMSAAYVTNAEESMKYQFMFGKRSIVQGMNVGENVKELPPHCRIEGYFAPATRFLIMLPDPANWNSRVLYASCDAFCGAVDQDMPVPGLLNGFATIATDGGHINKRPFDGTWGYNNREGEIDFGYRASHLAAQLVKVISVDYYGKPHSYSYISGFSKGGLAGIKAALMYPEDFDGVLSRAPVVRYQEINAVRMPWLYKANTRADGTAILLAADALTVHKAVIKACDSVDGVTDGIIDDPRNCQFSPASLLCKKEQKEGCLTVEQVDTVEKFYSQPKNDKGEVVYPYALEYGSEYDWMGFHTPRNATDPSFASTISSSFLRYMAFEQDPGASFDWLAFDPVKDGHKLEAMKHVWDATDPDLRAFKNAGGKMIVIHGWGDGAVSARMTIDWYESVKNFMGDTSDFAQLYVVPGNKHGGSPGDGPNINDSLNALIDWVEKDKAPEKLIFAMENKDGKVTRTRPAFPYPLKAKYKGSGSIDAAENFEPIMP